MQDGDAAECGLRRLTTSARRGASCGVLFFMKSGCCAEDPALWFIFQYAETERTDSEEENIFSRSGAMPVYHISYADGGICSSFFASVLWIQ